MFEIYCELYSWIFDLTGWKDILYQIYSIISLLFPCLGFLFVGLFTIPYQEDKKYIRAYKIFCFLMLIIFLQFFIVCPLIGKFIFKL